MDLRDLDRCVTRVTPSALNRTRARPV